jgi:uncharacterized protein YyaL (SSP411 family)
MLLERDTEGMTTGPMNRLADATSPYLLQHADNPVDWYEWGEDALAEARTRDVPIFLSVGYAACHWCHVMERESFEDASVATYLNDHFVSIKVDREERPDVDTIYMDAVQAMTGSGGWPMSVFLTPDGRPFYAGTYFPDSPRHGMPSFRQVLEGIHDAWIARRDEVEHQGTQVARAISTSIPSSDDTELDRSIQDDAYAVVVGGFDERWGGFGSAPKFPQPMTLRWLLRQHARGRAGALEMVTTTLARMGSGGIRDHVGGGFARYSTDERWRIPHFEKMLTDNAQLLQLYVEAWQVTGASTFRTVADQTAVYLIGDMQQPEGGFSSSQDADSDGVEGAYYTWSWDELLRAIGEPLARALGATPSGNLDGLNVLWRADTFSGVESIDPSPADKSDEIDHALGVLREIRATRTPPAIDDKVVAAWNGLVIAALAQAARATGHAPYLEAAVRAAGFVTDHMRLNGRLRRTWRAGRASAEAFLDDYALLGTGLLGLYEATGDPRWFREASWCSDQIKNRFGDPRGGFFLTADGTDRLVTRPREIVDTATPSGNAAAAELLARLALFTGDAQREDAARAAVSAVSGEARRHPTAFGHTLGVIDLLEGPNQQIAVVGPNSSSLREMREEVDSRFLPNAVLAIGIDGDAQARETVPLLQGRSPKDGHPTAFVCERFICAAPTDDPAVLATNLASIQSGIDQGS